jgi:hypothetical protein
VPFREDKTRGVDRVNWHEIRKEHVGYRARHSVRTTRVTQCGDTHSDFSHVVIILTSNFAHLTEGNLHINAPQMPDSQIA